MNKQEEGGAYERQLRAWLKKQDIPFERYENLSNSDKLILRKMVCTPTHHVSLNQRRDLYGKLCLTDIAGRGAIDPLDFMPEVELDKFFTRVSPSETLSYFEKF